MASLKFDKKVILYRYILKRRSVISMKKVVDEIKNGLEIFHMLKIPGLDSVEEQLYYMISDSNGLTHKICTDLIASGGKRIRPLLVLCVSQCFGPLQEEAIQTATAFEFIHMASLIHDDIIDESDTRRNKPTVNAKIGNESSVLIGDYLFAKSFYIFSKNRFLKNMELAVEAIGEMCKGEIFQQIDKFNLDQTIEDYYYKISKKTGILLSACCQAGAIVGQGSTEQVNALKVYGNNLGCVFQIVDDILDFIGTKEFLGKPVGSDLKEGNITLPIIKLIQQQEYKEWLQGIIARGEITSDRYYEIVRLLIDSYAIEESYKEAERCAQNAKNALHSLEDSTYKKILIDLPDQLIKRKN
jgi:heptaprenyl diphosphate synthase